MISDPLLLTLNISTLTVALFAVHLLVMRSAQHHAYLPLAGCLLCVGFLVAKPTVGVFLAHAQLPWLLFSLPVLLMIAPCFWFYVKGITNQSPWRIKSSDLKHFYLASIGLIIAVSSLFLPHDVLHSVIADDGKSLGLLKEYPEVLSYWINFSLITTFILVLIFVLQSGHYCLLIFRRLNHYKKHLKDLFASTETREMHWISTLLITIGGVWFITTINIIWDNAFGVLLIDRVFIDVIIFLMVWSVSIWGLRQKPGFEELYAPYNKAHNKAQDSDKTVQKKYQRSALDEQQTQTIAQAIVNAMDKDQLYLDNELSLQILAQHINTPANYISQTLNSTIGLNFFDFVNKYRIERAKKHLVNSSMAVIDIAFEAGFNAKSSFYKAFKKSTGMTPSNYRKRYR